MTETGGDAYVRGTLHLLRRILLAIVALGAAGLTTELLLLEHFEEWRQWMPLVLLALVLAATLAVLARPGPGLVRLFRLLMAACVVVGMVGVYLHYQGNVEFELERDPGLDSLRLFWESVRGATPTLAAGALAQLGLLGLAAAFRHPALDAAPDAVPDAARPGRAGGAGSRP